MTNEQLNQYYSKDADKKQCWVSKDHNCPLKEQCNGLVKPECKEHIDNEEACHVVDKMIEWYYQVEEPEFLKFYNCHLEMTEEEACKKMWSVDKIWMAPDPREPHDVPDDYIPPSNNT